MTSPYESARAIELARGSDYFSMQDGRRVVLDPPEGMRLLTDEFTGCTAVGYVALLEDGRRASYMYHAPIPYIAERKVEVSPVEGTVIKGKGVLMSPASRIRRPFPASELPRVPYDEWMDNQGLLSIANNIGAALGGIDAVTVVPYDLRDRTHQRPYANSMVLHIPPYDVGEFIVDGRVRV